jgi:peptidoglycan-associated lipoprotein
VFFSAGSAELGARAKSVLAAQARWLKEHPEIEVYVEGYSDDAPLAPGQQERLAEDRAEAVRRALEAEGIVAVRSGMPTAFRDGRITTCERPECAAHNRRAVTIVSERAGSRSALRLGVRNAPAEAR